MTRGHFDSIMDDMMSDRDWKQLAELLGKKLKSKDQEIVELKAKLQGSCEGCEHKSSSGGCLGNFMIRCSRFPHIHDHYTPKGE